MMLDWLADCLRAAGLDVYEMPGWEVRSTRSGGLTVKGIVVHHTATGPNWQDGHVAALLRDGRRDLAGPLAPLGVERDGTWVVVAAGRCNHNGYGTWGNDSIGVEAYNDGRGEPWPAVQIDSLVRGTAALVARTGLSIAEVRGHRETDPTRKIDPAGFSMDLLRVAIADRLNPVPQPDKDDDMVTIFIDRRGGFFYYDSRGPAFFSIGKKAEADFWASNGAVVLLADDFTINNAAKTAGLDLNLG